MTVMVFQTTAGEIKVEVNEIYSVYEIYNALAETEGPVIASECVVKTVNQDYTLG